TNTCTAHDPFLIPVFSLGSNISVVPPTPPPFSESQCSGSPGRVMLQFCLQELGQFKGFHKSVENLFLSVTTHVKKSNWMQTILLILCFLFQKVSTPDILKPFSQESPKRSTSPVLKQEGISSSPTPKTLFSGGLRHGSLISINSTCTEMGNFDNANVTGEIEFAIRYCFRTHSLEICIKACKNLAYGEEKKKKCNPYVKTYLLPDRSSQGKRKTGVQKNTVEPTFQETLKYRVEPAQLGTRRLQVSVWHLGTLTRRAFLGEVIIPLATWDFEDSMTQSFRWYPLRAKAEKYEDSVPPSNGELAVRAKLVLPAGPRKLQEAQEGSCLTLPDQQRLRLKSPVLKKQACPQWKHSFVFKGITPSQLRQSSLELTVWDQATFGVNDRLLGGVRLGSSKSAYWGKAAWLILSDCFMGIPLKAPQCGHDSR
ncbi:Synaptotagmin-like protein 3, partial [Camelus dromedarius]